MKRKILKGTVACLLMLALLVMPAAAVTIGGATVKTNDTGLNLRARATTASACLTEIPNGAFLLVEEALAGWYKVVYNGTEGYVSSRYASFAETQDGTYSFNASTSGTDVNMRTGASVNNGTVKCLAADGTSLTITGVSGSWLKVTDASGAFGYIRSDYVKYKNEVSAVYAETEGGKIAAAAQQYLGYNYTWGGMSPATGFDCSGLVNYVYSQYGYSLHRVAQDIYSYDGDYVAREYLQPGDILCFGYGPYSITHVGLYIGDGQMVHASTYTTGVITSDINSTYYTNMLVGAKRVA